MINRSAYSDLNEDGHSPASFVVSWFWQLLQAPIRQLRQWIWLNTALLQQHWFSTCGIAMENASSKEYPLRSSKNGLRKLLRELLDCIGRNTFLAMPQRKFLCRFSVCLPKGSFKHVLKKSPGTLTIN